MTTSKPEGKRRHRWRMVGFSEKCEHCPVSRSPVFGGRRRVWLYGRSGGATEIREAADGVPPCSGVKP